MPVSFSALSAELVAAIEAGAWILAPNQRSAHWLKLRYANHAVAQGRVAWATPAIHSFNSFALTLSRAQTRADERILTPEQSQLLFEHLVAESTWAEILLNPREAAAGAFQSWQRMLEWGITRQDLVAALDTNEAHALLEWSDQFLERCRQKSWLPSALLLERDLLSQDAALRATTLPKTIVTVARELLPAHRQLLLRLAERGVQWIELPQLSNTDVVSHRIGCDSFADEVRAAAAWTKRLLDQQAKNGSDAKDFSIGIVVPELDKNAALVRRVFADVFAQAMRTFAASNEAERRLEAQPSFALASYHRLAEFPVAQGALDLLRLAIGSAGSALVGSVLRSPFLVAGTDEASLRALADARLRGQAREHYTVNEVERAAAQSPRLAQAMRDVQAILSGMPSRALPSAMAERFIALWRAFGWPGEHVLNSDEQQVVARLQAALAEFGALDELLGTLTYAGAVHEFEQLVRDTSFEPRRAPTPITIVDVNSIEGLRFHAAWIVGMDESRWPPAATPDPFIPIALQMRVGMANSTAALTRERARRHFSALRQMAAQVVFSWARQDRDAERLASPWLAECDELLADANVEPAKSYAEYLFAAKPATEEIHEYGPAFSGAYARGGTRIFELQSLCPFRAFAELRLAAKPLEEVVTNVDARERGTLIHAALADIWQTLKNSAELHNQSAEQLAVLVRTSLARHAMKLQDGASLHRVRLLQIEQDLAAERILALLELERQRAAFAVVGRPETPEQVTVGTLAFELRLDRVDELCGDGLGQRVIVDYKTGANISTKSWTRDRPEQPQLPLYAVTHAENLAAVAFATLAATGVGYQGLAQNDGVLPGIKAFNDKYLPAPFVQWNGLLAYWETVIGRLAQQFVSGRAQVDPLATACRYCHLSVLCRIHEQDEFAIPEEESP